VRRRLSFDVLEDRWLPSAYTVNTLADYTQQQTESTPGGTVTYTSLRAAIDLANADQDSTVNIDFSVTGTITLEHGALPTLDGKTFTIDGTDITIDADGASGIFVIADDATATIDDFTLTNSDVAAAVINDGELTMNDVTVSDALAGGIDNYSACTTTGNVFIGGERTGNGAAINNNNGQYVVSGSWFESNTATGHGGAIFSTGTNATMTISGSSFLSNSAAIGGAIAIHSGTAELTTTQCYWNTATIGGGGGIWSSGTTTIGTGCEIMVNTAAERGGGVLISAGTTTINGGAQIYSNTAAEGGGIANFGTLIMSGGAILYQNQATAKGGGLYNDGTATLTNTTISSNYTNDPNNNGKGGGIYTKANKTTSTVSGCTISGNTSNQGNGAYIEEDGTLIKNPNDNTWTDDVVWE